MKKISILIIVSFLISFVGYSSLSKTEEPTSGYKPVVVFAVRHAEKVDHSKDPELSEAGKERAAVLAQLLRSTKIDHVHSSPYIRTRKTAEPTADRHGVKVQMYNPQDLSGLVEKIRKTGGRHLVVGHSNTTPYLAELLTGDTNTATIEEDEYDRLYILTAGKDGEASNILIRFGDPYDSKAGK